MDMKKDEIDDMITNMFHIFQWDMLVGERYSIKLLSGRSDVNSRWRTCGGATSSPTTAPAPSMLSLKKNVVVHASLHLIHHSILRQPKPLDELPGAPLDVVPSVAIFLHLPLPLAADLDEIWGF
nr:leafy [Ipomoea batatas]